MPSPRVDIGVLCPYLTKRLALTGGALAFWALERCGPVVEIEKLDDGTWRVSRYLTNEAAAMAAAKALERAPPDEAFEPGEPA